MVITNKEWEQCVFLDMHGDDVSLFLLCCHRTSNQILSLLWSTVTFPYVNHRRTLLWNNTRSYQVFEDVLCLTTRWLKFRLYWSVQSRPTAASAGDQRDGGWLCWELKHTGCLAEPEVPLSAAQPSGRVGIFATPSDNFSEEPHEEVTKILSILLQFLSVPMCNMLDKKFWRFHEYKLWLVTRQTWTDVENHDFRTPKINCCVDVS